MSTEIKLHDSINNASIENPEHIRGVVSGVAAEFADVAEREDVISDQLVDLASRHDIFEVMQDPVKSIILVGLASKMAAAYEQGDNSYAKQSNFCDTAIGLLLGEVQPYERIIDGDVIMNTYANYRNATLSRELDERIKDGLLDEVKQRMGITPENETPYQVHVLDIAPPGTLYGIEIPSDINSPQFASWRNEAIKDYQLGLCLGYWELRYWLKGAAPVADAWVAHYKGDAHLFVVNPTAEKLLNPEVTANSSRYDDMARQEDQALLEHEYVHTQNQLCLNGNIAFGMGLEELRAEHFSGNFTGSYEDTKSFFRGLHELSGIDMPKQFDAYPLGGTAEGILKYIAKRIGVESAVDVFMIPPESYCSPGSMQFIHDSLGGYGAVLKSILVKGLHSGGGEDITPKHTFAKKDKEGICIPYIGKYAAANTESTVAD